MTALPELLMAAAKLAIPPALALVLLRRPGILPAPLVLAGAVFLLGCGLLGALRLAGIDAPVLGPVLAWMTGLLGVGTAAGLWCAVPGLLAQPSAARLRREAAGRAAAEARARSSEVEAAALLAAVPEALFLLRPLPDGGFRFEAVNPAFERLIGLPARRLLGREAAEALPLDLAALGRPAWREAAETGRAMSYEREAETPAGRKAWQTVLVPLRGSDGRVERLLGSARDVTALRRLQVQVVQGARLASLGSLCAGLAHEASQPLNTAGLWLRRARAALGRLPEAEAAPAARAIGIAEDQLRRTGELVARIRELALPEPVDPGSFDVAGAVAAAVRAVAAVARRDGVALSVDLPAEGAAAGLRMRGAATRLEQAVIALLLNARDAALDGRRLRPEAMPRMSLALRAEGARVRIEVRDNGPGIPEALREAIFDPFFTTKEPGRGTGLGLTLAANVARALGGGIEAWNPPGGGACFRLDLPAIPPGPAAAPAAGQAAGQAEPAPAAAPGSAAA